MGSQQILLGSGGKAPFEGKFDKYGHWADKNDSYAQTELTSSNTITHVCNVTAPENWGANQGSNWQQSRVKIGSALVSRQNPNLASLENGYSSASLIQGRGGSSYAQEIRPTSGTWADVTGTGSCTFTTLNHTTAAPATGDVYWEYYACIFEADTNGQHAVGWGVTRSKMTGSSNAYPKLHIVFNKNGTLTEAEQTYDVTNLIDNWRFGHAVGSIKHNSATMFKDQDGSHSNWNQYGGQPRYLAIQNFNHSVTNWQNGISSPPSSTGDFAFVYSATQNTHGHSFSGGFLGGALTGAANEQVKCHYIGWYNNYSNNGHDGARAQSYLFDNQNSSYSSKSQATDSLDLGSGGAPSSLGYGLPCKNIYPHGLMHAITAGDSQVQPGFSNGQNKYIYLNIGANYGYSDTPTDLAITDENGNDQFGPICMVAKTATTFTFVALNLVSGKIEMYKHDISNNTTSSKLATAPSAHTSDEESIITSIHAVPFTNRILVCAVGYIYIYEIG